MASPSSPRIQSRKAFELKDRASEHEKLYISAHYYDEVEGNADKIVEIYEQWKQTYPRETLPWDNLALRYGGLGQHDKALANAAEAMRLDPKDNYAYQNLGDAYLTMNRFDEAQAVYDQAQPTRSSRERRVSDGSNSPTFAATVQHRSASRLKALARRMNHSSCSSVHAARMLGTSFGSA